jgi:hypothetical protein
MQEGRHARSERGQHGHPLRGGARDGHRESQNPRGDGQPAIAATQANVDKMAEEVQVVRVLHVTESRSWSGGTVQLWNLCVGLVKHGHAAALFCPPESEILRHAPRTARSVTLCPMREDYDLPAAWRLAQSIRRFKPDVVHAHHPRAHALALLASLFSTVPNLVVSRRVSFRLKNGTFSVSGNTGLKKFAPLWPCPKTFAAC